jgi:hypothetical protein
MQYKSLMTLFYKLYFKGNRINELADYNLITISNY